MNHIQNRIIFIYFRNPVIKALTSEILSVIKEIIRFNPGIRDHITHFSYTSGADLMNDPSLLADFAAALVPFGEVSEMQAVQESLVVEERLQKSLILLKKELANSKLQNQINADVEDRMNKTRNEYFLMENIKVKNTFNGRKFKKN